MRIRAAALRTAILPVFHLRTPSKGVPQMRIFPTPTESNGALESKGRELNIVGEERCLLSF